MWTDDVLYDEAEGPPDPHAYHPHLWTEWDAPWEDGILLGIDALHQVRSNVRARVAVLPRRGRPPRVVHPPIATIVVPREDPMRQRKRPVGERPGLSPAEAAQAAQMREALAEETRRRIAENEREVIEVMAASKAALVMAGERITPARIEVEDQVVTIETPAGLHRTMPAKAAKRLKLVGGGVPAAVFEPPPPPPPVRESRSKWTLFLAAVKAQPGEWAHTPFSLGQSTAKQMASAIRNGRITNNRSAPPPPGYAWETVAAELDGRWYVWVRLVPAQAQAEGQVQG